MKRTPMTLLREIKWAYQRAIHGIDERLRCGWGLMWLFNAYIKPDLIAFCKKQLEDEELMNYNPERKKVYLTTLELAAQMDSMEYKSYWGNDNEETRFWKYVGKHINWYWD